MKARFHETVVTMSSKVSEANEYARRDLYGTHGTGDCFTCYAGPQRRDSDALEFFKAGVDLEGRARGEVEKIGDNRAGEFGKSFVVAGDGVVE